MSTPHSDYLIFGQAVISKYNWPTIDFHSDVGIGFAIESAIFSIGRHWQDQNWLRLKKIVDLVSP